MIRCVVGKAFRDRVAERLHEIEQIHVGRLRAQRLQADRAQCVEGRLAVHGVSEAAATVFGIDRPDQTGDQVVV